jgi:uncharacterized protein YyaL (SSP411 family)
MMPPFRFSPRPNRAHEIQWRSWGKDAFADADAADRPVLLCLTAVWCQWCQQMDETTYSDAHVIELLNSHFVPIRVDADQYPHVHDRYIAGGWPTNAFLTPTGEVLWAGTYIKPEQFATVADGVRTAWSERRVELGQEIERRRKALEAARGRVTTIGIVRREAADDVWSALLESFDARHGGFGTAPKYPTPDAIELLLVKAGEENGTATSIAARTLDGMIAGELWDRDAGGFFRYAHGADWTQPQTEKLLTVNAGLLRAYALAGHVHQRAEWRNTAEQLVHWTHDTLGFDQGLWSSSQAAAPEYYQADRRSALVAPAVDTVLYTSANAQWIRALADAGARLGRPDWVQSATRALEQLHDQMTAPNGLFYHYREPGADPQLSNLLIDVLEVARACVAVAQATGRSDLLASARTHVAAIEKAFWADEGGFYDRTRTTHDVGVLRYRDRPFDTNADLARLLIELVLALGERSYRALAERTLALLSPAAGRYSVGGSGFALAVQEFFEPPIQFFIVGGGELAGTLRTAALTLPLPGRRVWPLPAGGQVGTQRFPLREPAAVYVVGPRGGSSAVTDPAALAEAVAGVS